MRPQSDFPNINLRMNKKTHKKLKLAADLLGRTMMDITTEAIEKYLKDINFDELYQQRLKEIK